MKLKSISAIATVLLALSIIGPALAVPSAMSHEMTGTIQRVDQKTITILSTGSSKPIVFAWNSKDTHFFRDDSPTTSESLPIGANVQIRCSHPIVGSAPRLYRVSWRTSGYGKRTNHIRDL